MIDYDTLSCFNVNEMNKMAYFDYFVCRYSKDSIFVFCYE